MIDPKQVISRARTLYSDVKKRSAPTYWKTGRFKGRVRWAGVPVPYSSDEFAAWLLKSVGCQAFLCPYCQAPLDALSMTLDHGTPLHGGGTNDFDNLVPSCSDCNNVKGKLDYASYLLFRKLLRQLPPPAEADVLRRLRSGAMGMRLSQQMRAAKSGSSRKPAAAMADDEPF